MQKFQFASSFAVAALMTSAAFAAAAEKFQMQNGPRTPAAMGTIEFQREKAGNNKLVVSVEHVAQPRDIDPSLSTIAVWLEPGRGEAAVLLGMMPLDKDLKGRLQTQTPYSNFEVLVTAEATPAPRRPSEYVILRGNVPEAGKPPAEMQQQQRPGESPAAPSKQPQGK